MLNAEKNKKVILDLTEGGYYFAVRKDEKNIARSCDGLKCEDCIFDEEEDYDCSFSRMKWMLSEYKDPVKLKPEPRRRPYCRHRSWRSGHRARGSSRRAPPGRQA